MISDKKQLEKQINTNAAVVAGVFWSIALLIWSLYDLITIHSPNMPLLLLLAGIIVQSFATFYYRRKAKRS